MPRQFLSESAVQVMKGWLLEHLDNPYPNLVEKWKLAERAKIDIKQVCYWFTNARRRKLVSRLRLAVAGGLLLNPELAVSRSRSARAAAYAHHAAAAAAAAVATATRRSKPRCSHSVEM